MQWYGVIKHIHNIVQPISTSFQPVKLRQLPVLSSLSPWPHIHLQSLQIRLLQVCKWDRTVSVSSDWLILLSIMSSRFHFMYLPHFACQWTPRLLLCFSYCEFCCCGHVSSRYISSSFRHTPRSGIAAAYRNSFLPLLLLGKHSAAELCSSPHC